MSDTVAEERVHTRGAGTRVTLSVLGALLSVLLIVTGILSLLGTGSGAAPGRSSLVGTRVAGFILPGVNRGAVRAPWLSHRPAVLLFFAYWCTPCHAELPTLSRYLATGRIGRVLVVGIDGDHSPSVALSFITSSDARFPVAQDANLAVASSLVPAFPAAVFVTSRGIVAAEHYGVISGEQLMAGASKLR